MEQGPSTDNRAWNIPSYLFVEGNKESSRKCVKYGTTKSMTARRDHDGPSRGTSTQTRFERFSVIRILLL